jgi:hypothetical protein
MTTIEIKTSLHKLIDSIDDETQLTKAYQLIETISTVNEDGALWAKLTSKEQEELLDIEKESRNPGNLIDHEEMMKKYRRWLSN